MMEIKFHFGCFPTGETFLILFFFDTNNSPKGPLTIGSFSIGRVVEGEGEGEGSFGEKDAVELLLLKPGCSFCLLSWDKEKEEEERGGDRVRLGCKVFGIAGVVGNGREEEVDVSGVVGRGREEEGVAK